MSDWDEDDKDPKPKTLSYSNANNGRSFGASKYHSTNNNNDWGDGWDTNNKQQQSRSSDGYSFEVNGQHVGKIIGSRGATIRDIEQRFNVNLKIDKGAGRNGNAVVNVTGDTRSAEDAKRYVEDLLQNTGSQSRYDNRDNHRPQSNSRFNNRDGNRDDGERIEINPENVGMVIGRGGGTIRDLQEKHSVRINVDRNQNGNGMATVMISGDRNNIQNAIRDINDITSGGSRREPAKPSQPEPMEAEPFVQIDWQAAARESDEANRRKWALLPPLQKEFYKEHPDVANMSAEKVAAIRLENNNITVDRLILEEKENPRTGPIPNPIETFEQCFADYPDLLDEIKKQGFQKPSPIQAQAWPILLSGEDMIGIAQTGTGKTLAFLLPAMIHTEYQSIPRSERKGPNVLVLAPTRELALQIEKEVKKYNFRGMKAVCVYGGGDRGAQIQNISSGVEIIIATPGRLNDLVEANVIDVHTITYLVLDEADRMLDMGFEPQIRKTLLDIRPDKQIVMTSATWPTGVRRLAQRYMNNPIQVCVGTLDLAAVHSVTQTIKFVEEEDKYNEIMSFVKNMDPDEKAIIFCGKKARVDDLSSEFSLEGIACQCIHGNRDQSDREQALVDIKEGVVKILIATDVASRGIDIEDLSYVVNYDFPRDIEEYVHRVGRTGRAGRTGVSISFVSRSDWASAGELIKILEEADQFVPEELIKMKERFDSMKEKRDRERANFGGGGGGRRFGGGDGGRGRRRY